MAIATEFDIDYALKTISHNGTASTIYTVNELYSWIMALFDDDTQMDDSIPMSAQTPNEYKVGTDANGNLTGWSISDNSYPYLTDGSILDTTNNNLWANVYTLGSIVAGSQIYIIQDGAELPLTWATGHINILVKITSSGVPIGDKKLLLMIRDNGNSFDHVEIDFSTKSVLPASLATTIDLNNTTLEATVSSYTNIVPTFNIGAVLEDFDGGTSNTYDVSIECAGRPLSEVYEYLKYITRHDSASTLNGAAGDLYLSAVEGYTEIRSAPFGSFAGGKFFGAQGIWLENFSADDGNNLQLIDAAGTVHTPPNVVAVKVTGVVEGDRVLVGQLDGVDGNLTGTNYLDNIIGVGETVLQTNLTYTADIPVLVRVRRYGILPFEVESTITSTGMSVAAIRTTDGIVS